MSSQSLNLSERLASVQSRINEACASVGRNPGEVTLVAVTKGVDVNTILDAYELGLRNFGESRFQDAKPKLEALPKDIVWHFIGPLQSNKAKAIAEHFAVIHSVYKLNQIKEIEKAQKAVDVLIEINIGDEAQKAGLLLSKSPTSGELTLDECLQTLANCDQVHFRGLMTIGPDLEDPQAMRPLFRKLRDENQRVGGQWLSMGMSGDFEVAIQEGATHVRVGSALFKGS